MEQTVHVCCTLLLCTARITGWANTENLESSALVAQQSSSAKQLQLWPRLPQCESAWRAAGDNLHGELCRFIELGYRLLSTAPSCAHTTIKRLLDLKKGPQISIPCLALIRIS